MGPPEELGHSGRLGFRVFERSRSDSGVTKEGLRGTVWSVWSGVIVSGVTIHCAQDRFPGGVEGG